MSKGRKTEQVKQVEKRGLVWEAQADQLSLLIRGAFEDIVGGKEWESCLGSYFGGLDCFFLLKIQPRCLSGLFKYVDFVDW